MFKPGRAANDNEPSAAGPRGDAAAGAERRHKQILATEDLPEWLIERIARAEMGPELLARPDRSG